VKPPFSAGVLLLVVAGVFAYAITAIMAEANFGTGAAARTPMEAIGKSLSMIRTNRRLPNDIGKRLDPVSSWSLSDGKAAGQ
jgi:hypothetical protein